MFGRSRQQLIEERCKFAITRTLSLRFGQKSHHQGSERTSGAKLITLVCYGPLEQRSRWTLRLLGLVTV